MTLSLRVSFINYNIHLQSQHKDAYRNDFKVLFRAIKITFAICQPRIYLFYIYYFPYKYLRLFDSIALRDVETIIRNIEADNIGLNESSSYTPDIPRRCA